MTLFLYFTHIFTHFPTWELTLSDQLHRAIRFGFGVLNKGIFTADVSSAAFSSWAVDFKHRSASPNSRLVSYIKGLLTSLSQRQKNEHGCCSCSWHYRPDCGCPLCLVLNQCSHGIHEEHVIFGRTHNETLREIETQHPLVLVLKPRFPVLFVPVHVLTNAKAQVEIH